MATTVAPPELENPNPKQSPSETSSDLAHSPLPAGDEPNKASPPSNAAVATDDVAEVNAIQKKMKRAERFGVPVHLSEVEKRNSRAERFGTTPTACAPEATKSSEELKKKARAERFGIVQAASANEESKKKARLERFGAVPKTDSLEEEKKKARAIRFSQSQPNLKPQENATGPIESKTVGEAGVA